MKSFKILRFLSLAFFVGTVSTLTSKAVGTFVATGGDVTAYFVSQTAAYGSMVGLSINGAAPTSFGLQNHTATYGTSFVMGTPSAGDILRFVLSVDTTSGAGPADPFSPSYFINSDPTFNATGETHVMVAATAGDPGIIPAGIGVGFEDITPLSDSDRDFDDHVFVFTNIRPTSSSVPDTGSTALLLGAGFLGLAAIRRRIGRN